MSGFVMSDNQKHIRRTSIRTSVAASHYRQNSNPDKYRSSYSWSSNNSLLHQQHVFPYISPDKTVISRYYIHIKYVYMICFVLSALISTKFLRPFSRYAEEIWKRRFSDFLSWKHIKFFPSPTLFPKSFPSTPHDVFKFLRPIWRVILENQPSFSWRISVNATLNHRNKAA